MLLRKSDFDGGDLQNDLRWDTGRVPSPAQVHTMKHRKSVE